jgi:hypothetical protein
VPRAGRASREPPRAPDFDRAHRRCCRDANIGEMILI